MLGQRWKTLHYTAQMPQWNRFRIIYGKHRLYIGYNVILETQQSSIFGLEQSRLERLKLMKLLYDIGWNSVEISNHLISQNIRSPKGHLYTPKLVWVSHNKYIKRLTRYNSPSLYWNIQIRLQSEYENSIHHTSGSNVVGVIPELGFDDGWLS